MAPPTLTPRLRAEYQRLSDTCVIRSASAGAVEALVAKLAANRARYEAAGAPTGTPWHAVAVIHNMEAGQNFNSHLHNGDPLTARTVHVPAGRPPTGKPPFTWEASAADALKVKGFDRWKDWSAAGTLYKLEGYNGFGYRMYHPQVLSPYLWSFSNHYVSGKYVGDGTWSDTAVSQQCGVAVLLRRLAEQGLVDFAAAPTAPPAAPAPWVRYSADKEIPHGRRLQEFLNGFPGVFVKVDGAPGDRTSDAFRKVTGRYLEGDPRA